jgi:hypothetical protein
MCVKEVLFFTEVDVIALCEGFAQESLPLDVLILCYISRPDCTASLSISICGLELLNLEITNQDSYVVCNIGGQVDNGWTSKLQIFWRQTEGLSCSLYS